MFILHPCMMIWFCTIDTRTAGSNDSTELQGKDFFIKKEKKLVDQYIIKSGMLRFSFLLECCTPGSLPDPQLVAAMLVLVSTYNTFILFIFMTLSLNNIVQYLYIKMYLD